MYLTQVVFQAKWQRTFLRHAVLGVPRSYGGMMTTQSRSKQVILLLDIICLLFGLVYFILTSIPWYRYGKSFKWTPGQHCLGVSQTHLTDSSIHSHGPQVFFVSCLEIAVGMLGKYQHSRTIQPSCWHLETQTLLPKWRVWIPMRCYSTIQSSSGVTCEARLAGPGWATSPWLTEPLSANMC